MPKAVPQVLRGSRRGKIHITLLPSVCALFFMLDGNCFLCVRPLLLCTGRHEHGYSRGAKSGLHSSDEVSNHSSGYLAAALENATAVASFPASLPAKQNMGLGLGFRQHHQTILPTRGQALPSTGSRLLCRCEAKKARSGNECATVNRYRKIFYKFCLIRPWRVSTEPPPVGRKTRKRHPHTPTWWVSKSETVACSCLSSSSTNGTVSPVWVAMNLALHCRRERRCHRHQSHRSGSSVGCVFVYTLL